jgi:mitochondrial fission protein ELM1
MSNERIIWIVSEGSPGHVSQSTGIASAIARSVPVRMHTLDCRPRIRGITRSLIRLLWMGKAGRPLPSWMLNGPIGLERIPMDALPPDLILSSGGKSVFAARSLAVRHRVPFVFVGERKPYAPRWFHTVLTPSSLENAVCDVRMDLIPTKINPQIVSEAAATWKDKPGGRLWAMLIGGSSRSHQYTPEDWQNLANGMATLAQREHIRWLVTTSRRTGRETEELLRKLLPDRILADAIWWCHEPQKKLAAYLGSSENVWVTQDSVSMITEAISAARPVVVVRPRHTPFPKSSFMPSYFERLENIGLVSRLEMHRMADYQGIMTPPGNSSDSVDQLAACVIRRLGWHATPSPTPHQTDSPQPA